MYSFIISIVTPPVVIRQYDLDQNYSFHSFSLISGYSCLISLDEADLYAFMNFDISVLGQALNSTCT
jgi:hypothetical protein